MWAALSTPLFAMALCIGAYRLGWPDPDEVAQINDALARTRETAP